MFQKGSDAVLCVRILPRDRVKIEVKVSRYDSTGGRIIYRLPHQGFE